MNSQGLAMQYQQKLIAHVAKQDLTPMMRANPQNTLPGPMVCADL